MIERKQGKIIHIASLMSELARPTVVPYTAAKGGVRQLTRGMAVELAPHGIQVNAIAPGYFATEMNRALIDNAGVRRLGEEAHAGGPLGRAAGDRGPRGLPRLARRELHDRTDPRHGRWHVVRYRACEFRLRDDRAGRTMALPRRSTGDRHAAPDHSRRDRSSQGSHHVVAHHHRRCLAPHEGARRRRPPHRRRRPRGRDLHGARRRVPCRGRRQGSEDHAGRRPP